MRKLLFILLFPCVSLAQQGVAITADGSLPSTSAILEVKSSTKGFLIPRMTQSQRTAIVAPENGLLVFDIDAQRLFQRRDGVWRFLADNTYWTKSASRNWVYNLSDSIGIGTAAPTERLHVSNGNFRVLNGDVSVQNGDIILNNTSGQVHFQASGVNKAFMQLSGNNLRIGTFADNTNGNVRLQTNGQTNATIDDAGLSIPSAGRMTRPATGGYHLMAYCYGKVNADGSIQSGTGNFQVTRVGSTSTIEYRIVVGGIEAYTNPQTAIIITPRIANVASYGYFVANNGYFEVKLSQTDVGSVEGGFDFVIYKF